MASDREEQQGEYPSQVAHSEDATTTTTSSSRRMASSSLCSSCPGNRKAPSIKFPWALIVLLVLTSAAQYAGTNSIGLLVMLTLHYGPVETNNFWMIMGLVGFASPVLGWFSDVFTPLGERRRPCLALGLTMNGLLMILMSHYATQVSKLGFILMALVQTISESLVSIPLNGMVVELCNNTDRMRNIKRHAGGKSANANTAAAATSPLLNQNESPEDDEGDEKPVQLSQEEKTRASGAGQSTSMLIRCVGSLVGGVLQTLALTKVDPRGPILGAGIAYLCCLSLIYFLPKHCTSPKDALNIVGQSFRARMKEMKVRVKGSTKGGVTRSQFSGLVSLVLFVFAYTVMPGATTIYYQFISVNFRFSAAFISATGLAGLVSSILACYVYQWKLSQKNQSVLFVVGCAAMSVGYVTNIMLATGFSKNTLGISDHVFVTIDSALVSFFSRLAFMPVLQLASSRCPVGFEAVVFELFTATSLGASSVSALLTTVITLQLGIETGHYERLWILLVICAASKWIPVFFLGCLPKVMNDDDKKIRGVETEKHEGEKEQEGGEDTKGSGTKQAAVVYTTTTTSSSSDERSGLVERLDAEAATSINYRGCV